MKTIKTMKRIILSVALIALSFTSFAQAGIGTTSPDASAVLDVSSVTKGFLPPRMTETQMNAISSPVEGLFVYCTDCTPKGLYLFNGDSFFSMSFGGESTTGTTVVNDVAGTNGRVWMDRNLGATQVAASSTDADSYGDLYQWGRAKDGHESRTSDKTSTTATSGNPGHGDFIIVGDLTDNNWTDFTAENNLWQSGLNDPCPLGYRIPTDAELNGERLNFSTQNAAGAFASPLKLPVSGLRHYTSGDLTNVGSEGRYWSSTLSGNFARNLYFFSGDAYIVALVRAYGFSVRCIKD